VKRLVTGELRQGALAGLMVDALAKDEISERGHQTRPWTTLGAGTFDDVEHAKSLAPQAVLAGNPAEQRRRPERSVGLAQLKPGGSTRSD
jgi:hypothetical protein